MSLHDTQEFDDNFRAWPDEHLALTTAFGIDDVVLSGRGGQARPGVA